MFILSWTLKHIFWDSIISVIKNVKQINIILIVYIIKLKHSARITHGSKQHSWYSNSHLCTQGYFHCGLELNTKGSQKWGKKNLSVQIKRTHQRGKVLGNLHLQNLRLSWKYFDPWKGSWLHHLCDQVVATAPEMHQ